MKKQNKLIVKIKLFLILFTSVMLFLASTGIHTISAKEAGDSEWFKVAKNTYVFRYLFYYSLFVKTESGVVAFDPLSDEAAEHYVKAIKQALPGEQVRAIVYTHWHVDHSTGATILRREFGNSIPIIAHERTRIQLKEWDDKNILLPTKTITDKGFVISDKENPIELKYIGYAHTDTMLIAYLPQQKLIFGVDFVNHDSMGWRDLPGVDVDELVAMQRRLLDIDFTIITFGHGRPGNREVVQRQIEYYQTLLNETESGIKKGLSEDEVVAKIKLPQYRSWGNYDNWFESNVRGTYRWVKQR